MWWYYGHDAYYEQVLEYELGYAGCGTSPDHEDAGRPRQSNEPIPLRWVTAWIGGLSIISLLLGLASCSLLQ